MRIRFLQDQVTAEAQPQSFKAEEIYDLIPSSARRWLRRGVAIEVAAATGTKVKPDKKKRRTRRRS